MDKVNYAPKIIIASMIITVDAVTMEDGWKT
jgi:hypothetical protein